MRLIDADALTISTAVPLDGKPYQYVHIDNIKAAPTVDAVPVVRCKDCKWYRIDGGHSNCGWRNMDDDFSENFYCADGERKGGDE